MTVGISGARPGLSRRYASETLTPARWRARASGGPPRRVLIVADPTEDLPSAREEGAALRCRCCTPPAYRCASCSVEEATRSRILRELAAGRSTRCTLLVACILRELESCTRRSRLCANDEVLRGSDLDGQGDSSGAGVLQRVRGRAREATRPRPFSSLCACGPARSASPRHSRRWRRQLHRHSGLLATRGRQPVRDQFHTHLVRGDDLGAAILASRRLLHGRELADWADYVHYGSPACATCVTKRSSMTRDEPRRRSRLNAVGFSDNARQ